MKEKSHFYSIVNLISKHPPQQYFAMNKMTLAQINVSLSITKYNVIQLVPYLLRPCCCFGQFFSFFFFAYKNIYRQQITTLIIKKPKKKGTTSQPPS